MRNLVIPVETFLHKFLNVFIKEYPKKLYLEVLVQLSLREFLLSQKLFDGIPLEICGETREEIV